MGWLAKGALLTVMLLAAAFSAWIVAVPIGLYFVYLLFHRDGGPRRRDFAKESREPSVLTRIPKDKVFGVFFLGLVVVARAEGGTYSVVVLLGMAILTLFGRPILSSGVYSEIAPVENSTLVRKRAFPFRWYSIVEVKPSRGTLPSFLSSVQEKVIITAGERVSVLVEFATYSFSKAGAETTILCKIRKVSRALAPVGAYILPLDSGQARAALSLKLEREKIEEKDWPTSLEGASFNMVVLKAKGGFVQSFGAYTAEPDDESQARIPAASQHLGIQPLAVEALEELGRKLAVPQPDGVTSFLASLCAGRGEPQGQVIQFEESKSGNAGLVTVRALSSPTVEIERAQLRTLARVYLNGGR